MCLYLNLFYVIKRKNITPKYNICILLLLQECRSNSWASNFIKFFSLCKKFVHACFKIKIRKWELYEFRPVAAKLHEVHAETRNDISTKSFISVAFPFPFISPFRCTLCNMIKTGVHVAREKDNHQPHSADRLTPPSDDLPPQFFFFFF